MTREDLYRMFGPKLVEAVILVIKDEINLLRAEHSLPERTNEQIVDAVGTKLGTLSDYDWMDEDV